jgi:hypothetical protein
MQDRISSAQAKYGEFLRHASFCDALAASMVEPVDRAALAEMAKRWRALARYARRQARIGVSCEPAHAQTRTFRHLPSRGRSRRRVHTMHNLLGSGLDQTADVG